MQFKNKKSNYEGKINITLTYYLKKLKIFNTYFLEAYNHSFPKAADSSSKSKETLLMISPSLKKNTKGFVSSSGGGRVSNNLIDFIFMFPTIKKSLLHLEQAIEQDQYSLLDILSLDENINVTSEKLESEISQYCLTLIPKLNEINNNNFFTTNQHYPNSIFFYILNKSLWICMAIENFIKENNHNFGAQYKPSENIIKLLPINNASVTASCNNQSIYNFSVAGFQYRPLFSYFYNSISSGDELELRLEPSNLHDKLAIAIMWNNIHIGYVPRPINTTISYEIKSGKKASAHVVKFPTVRLILD